MGKFGIAEMIIVFAIVVGPILAAVFMAGYVVGKKRGLKEAQRIMTTGSN